MKNIKTVFIFYILLGIVVSSLILFAGSNRTNQKKMPADNMVLISGGTYIMGKAFTPEELKKKVYRNNIAHKVKIDSFYIDQYEVTNQAYYQFCQKTKRDLPIFWGMDEFRCGLKWPNHPVIGVSYLDALAYAKWVGKRLPTEAEWEYAARGGLIGKKYPHGNDLNIKHINYGRKLKGTLPVNDLIPNGYGLFHMAGNVREWVSDWYHTDYFQQSGTSNPTGPKIGRFRVIRGGSWLAGPGCVTVYRRNALSPNWVDIGVGFRCVKNLPKEGKTK